MPSAAPSRAFYTYQQTQYIISSTSLRRCSPKHSLPTPRISHKTIHYYTTGRPPSFRRPDFSGQGYTGTYDPEPPLRGPLKSAASNGVSKVFPKDLKKHLDQYVVGQERSKVMISTAFFYHHVLTLRRQRLWEEEEERIAKKERLERSMPDDPEPIPSNLSNPRSFRYDRFQDRNQEKKTSSSLLSVIEDNRPINIQKSNILMLGPTGVGKTLIVQ